MGMSSRERVMTAFAHKQPDRVPMWCGASAEFWEKAGRELKMDDEALRVRFHDDFRRVGAVYEGPRFELSDAASGRTVFGVERTGLGYGQPLSHPLAEASLKEINDYPWPDPAWMDVSKIHDQAAEWGGEYAILGGDWSPFWHDAIDLLGMENMYLKMYTAPELVEAVMRHLVDYYHAVSVRIFEAVGRDIDIFFIGNDFGSTTGPLLSEELFRQFIQSHLKRLIDLGHDFGLKVMMHCCGGVAQLIPLMIEIRLDALHAVQPNCKGMDLRTLKANFGEKILFNGCIDSQHVLIDGTPDFVREKTVEVLDIMSPGGGYVAGASHDSILEETPLENVLTMFDTVAEYGK